MMPMKQVAPVPIPQVRRPFRGVHDVGEQRGGNDAVRLSRSAVAGDNA